MLQTLPMVDRVAHSSSFTRAAHPSYPGLLDFGLESSARSKRRSFRIRKSEDIAARSSDYPIRMIGDPSVVVNWSEANKPLKDLQADVSPAHQDRARHQQLRYGR